MTYTEFARESCAQLTSLQEAFKSRYQIDAYENWFYNQSTGLFTFSTGKEQINFAYQSVGTFSRNTNTWLWAWDNEDTEDRVKDKIDAVQQLGKEQHYEALTNGYLESSEEEAWEFTAIAARVLNAIGVYRTVDEHLLSFKVFTEVIDNATAKKIKDRFVECADHEYRRRAFVCQHQNHEDVVGFEEAFETEEGMELGEDDDFQAWCNKCEEVRGAEGEWNDTSMAFANIKLVCEACYFEMKELNLGYR